MSNNISELNTFNLSYKIVNNELIITKEQLESIRKQARDKQGSSIAEP